MKTTPKKDSGLFGNLFDLNGDGKTDASEAAFMFMMFDEMQKEGDLQKQAYAPPKKIRDLDEIDIDEATVDLDDLDMTGI